MTKLEKIKKELSKLKLKEAQLVKQEETEQSKKLIECTGCKKKTQIGKIVYIQTHHYIEPHGCTGGDYWVESEGLFICPKCSAENRMYDRTQFQDLKYQFKKITDYHGYGSGYSHYDKPDWEKVLKFVEKHQNPPKKKKDIDVLQMVLDHPLNKKY